MSQKVDENDSAYMPNQYQHFRHREQRNENDESLKRKFINEKKQRERNAHLFHTFDQNSLHSMVQCVFNFHRDFFL